MVFRFPMSIIPVCCVLAAVLLAAAGAPTVPIGVHSKCIASDLASMCPLVPYGMRERYLSPDKTVSFYVWSLCQQEGGPRHRVFVTDISHSGRGLEGDEAPIEVQDDVMYVGVPEPGTQLFNATLVESGTVIDSLVLCMEVVPGPWEAELEAYSDGLQSASAGVLVRREVAAYARAAQAGLQGRLESASTLLGVDNGLPVQSVVPMSILWVRAAVCVRAAMCSCVCLGVPSPSARHPLRSRVQVGDTQGYDGMKRFHLNHLRHFPRALATHTRIDLMCADVPG